MSINSVIENAVFGIGRFSFIISSAYARFMYRYNTSIFLAPLLSFHR